MKSYSNAITFSKGTLQCFRSYLSELVCFVNIESKLLDFGKISCGVPQGSIVGPLLFFICVKDMPQAVRSSILLYAGDSCILYQHKEGDETEKLKHGLIKTLKIFVTGL